jgi:hypothetical protein
MYHGENLQDEIYALHVSFNSLVPAFNLSPMQDSEWPLLHSTKIDMRPMTSDSDVPRKGGMSRTSISTSGKEKKVDGESTLQKWVLEHFYNTLLKLTLGPSEFYWPMH